MHRETVKTSGGREIEVLSLDAFDEPFEYREEADREVIVNGVVFTARDGDVFSIDEHGSPTVKHTKWRYTMAGKKTGRERTLRVNLSLDPKVLAMADRQAEAEGRASRSAHIAELIKDHEGQMELMKTGPYAQATDRSDS